MPFGYRSRPVGRVPRPLQPGKEPPLMSPFQQQALAGATRLVEQHIAEAIHDLREHWSRAPRAPWDETLEHEGSIYCRITILYDQHQVRVECTAAFARFVVQLLTTQWGWREDLVVIQPATPQPTRSKGRGKKAGARFQAMTEAHFPGTDGWVGGSTILISPPR